MKTYIDSILHEIFLQNKSNSVSLIRFEGINNPIIYMEVCKYLKNTLIDTEFIAKLSKEKYDFFNLDGKSEWKPALDFLISNDYVDNNGAMTAWRNNTSELVDEVKDRKVIVLLMGTESVPDKGGLADFYYISPDTILKTLSKNYSNWFEDLFNDKGFNKEDLKAVNTIFKVIFSYKNVDLIRFSSIIDELSNKQLYSADELIEEICYRLASDWGIPAIRSSKKVPKCKNLKSGKVKSADIIGKSYSFITRQAYKNGISNSNYNKLIKKIDKYAEEHSVKIHEPFPHEDSLFNSFEEFKQALLDFILGKNHERIREKFIDIDYSIIDELLSIKTETGTAPKPPKANKLVGNPIDIYLEMILKVSQEYRKQYEELPRTIKIKVNDIKLSNCSTIFERDNAYKRVCIFLGGIVDYINESHIIQSEGVELSYEDGMDPFNDANKEDLSITKTANMNELSKIYFTIKAEGETDEIRKQEFIFLFESNASWSQAFSLLNQDSLLDYDSDYIRLPLYGCCSQIDEYICCESEEEFFIKLEKMNLIYEYEEYINRLTEEFPQIEIRGALGLLEADYKEFLLKLMREGFYKTIGNDGYCSRVFNRYTELIRIVRDNYENLTSSQKEKIYMILNIFIISSSDFYRFIESNINSVILPPYNPVMLEKLYHQMYFMRSGFDEILELIKSGRIVSETDIERRLGYFTRTCIITSGVDVISLNRSNQISTDKVYHFYAIYNIGKCSFNLISEKVFESELVDDEELDKKDLIKKSHKSDILSKNIDDYLKTFPSTLDGINVLFINPDDMQHVVAGVHDVIDKIKDRQQKGKINLRIIVSDKRKNGADYLKYWLDAFFADESDIEIRTYLNYADFSSPRLKENIEKYVEYQDIVFLYNILESSGIEFDRAITENSNDGSMYPAIFTPLPVSITQDSRGVDISQRQFKTSNEHLQLLHKYIRPFTSEGSYKVIRKLKISEISKGLIGLIHEKCKWVICIDQSIDKEILNHGKRKIIGFSTGQGIFGELNVTVSAREDIIEDIQLKLKQRLINKFSRWNTKRLEEAAKYCIDLTKDMDGSRLLKALNPVDHEIHSFLAYVLTIQSLQLNLYKEKFLIRTLINLDNHQHWFDTNIRDNDIESNSRPDFLLLEIENNEENLCPSSRLKIKATVIECKMGFENEGHIIKAKNQIKHGIKVLARNFDTQALRVNKRYWFNQLYRALVFSEIQIEDNKPEYMMLVNKLTNIYNGNFDIDWNGSIYAYWLNQDDDRYTVENFDFDEEELEFNINHIRLYKAGQLFIQKLLVPSSERNEVFEFNEIAQQNVTKEFYTELIEDKTEEELVADSSVEAKGAKIVKADDDYKKDQVEITTKYQDTEGKPQNETIKATSIYNEGVGQVKFELKGNVAEADLSYQRHAEIKSIVEEKNVDSRSLKYVRFLLGKDYKSNEEMYWEFGNPQLNNRHLLINGSSGSGKTYCIQTLIMEAVKNEISVIVFDYTDGFTESKLSNTLKAYLGSKLKERSVKYEKFPVNPFKKHKVFHGGKEFDEFNADIANRIASSFKAVYKFGDQQRNVVYEAVLQGLEKNGNNMNFRTMAELIYESKNSSASTVYSKIKPFIDYDPFLIGNEFSWKDILDSKGELYIIQLSGFDREIQVMLTEIILWDIWSYATKFGSEDNPMPIVLDEAHNLSHDSTSPSGRILAEGRKFGISGWYATQFMKGRMDSESIGNLQQAAQKLYFSPPEETLLEVSKYIDITSDGSKAWAERLKKLTKGNCVTCGFRMKNNKFDKYEPKIVGITSLEDRLNE
jgi:DNA phosphorothioation-dependent restriction protein DptH